MKNTLYLAALAASACFVSPSAPAFEGRIAATAWQGGQAAEVLYTVGQDQLRIEQTDTNRPHARNIVQLQTGDLVLLFPHNRSFVRLKASGASASSPVPADVTAGGAGIGTGPSAVPGAGALPETPAMPAMPQMPQMPQMPDLGGGMPMMPPMEMMEQAELTATGQQTNLLGYACEKFELRQRDEVMEIWATDALLPFHAWQANQPHRFGPRMMEEQWPELLKTRKLFPLRASLRFGSDTERLLFEVKAITPEKIEDPDGALFQPPADYHELEPLPF